MTQQLRTCTISHGHPLCPPVDNVVHLPMQPAHLPSLCLCCVSRLAPLAQSYAGKYVPSISHYIVQAAAMHDGTAHKLRKVRALPTDVEAPVFKLGGLAIGNGFTEAVEQTLVQVRR